MSRDDGVTAPSGMARSKSAMAFKAVTLEWQLRLQACLPQSRGGMVSSLRDRIPYSPTGCQTTLKTSHRGVADAMEGLTRVGAVLVNITESRTCS